MKRLIVALAVLLFGAAGCDTNPQPETPPAPALWQIESANGEVEGWLFGTIHALPDGTSWRTDVFEEALAQADILAVEIADFDNPEIFRQLATTRGLGPLRQRVSPDYRKPLHRMMLSAGFSEGRFSDVEDWAAAITLAQIGRDANPANGVDQALIRAARDPFTGGRAIEVIELEGAYAQLSIFDRLAASDQKALLHSAIDEFDTPENEAEELRVLWLAGNEEDLEAAVMESFEETPGLYKALMTDRNEAMAGKVLAMLDLEEQLFVAVGAAHMLGAVGLPALIRAEGYQVRRLQ